MFFHNNGLGCPIFWRCSYWATNHFLKTGLNSMKATSLVSFLYGVYQSPYEKNYSVGLRRILCSLKWEDASLESSCHHERSDEFAFRMWNIWAKSWKNQGSRKHTHHWVHGRVSKIWLPIDCETPVSVRRVALSCCWHFNYNGRSTIFKWEFSIAMLVFGGVVLSGFSKVCDKTFKYLWNHRANRLFFTSMCPTKWLANVCNYHTLLLHFFSDTVRSFFAS